MRKNTALPTAAQPHPVADCGPIYVEFLAEQSFGVANIKKFLEHAAANNFRSGILITHVAVSPGARKYLTSRRVARARRVLPRGGLAHQHHAARAGAAPRAAVARGKGGPAQAVPRKGNPAAQNSAKGRRGQVLLVCGGDRWLRSSDTRRRRGGTRATGYASRLLDGGFCRDVRGMFLAGRFGFIGHDGALSMVWR